ncbi:MAG: hypothetical protein ABS81_13305 [Pseudonocardia sp. SCN 72-86]|nr:MAG: hypothetical protein ABS81_13305 [Pseudonocardia sp. SCN 72-86]
MEIGADEPGVVACVEPDVEHDDPVVGGQPLHRPAPRNDETDGAEGRGLALPEQPGELRPGRGRASGPRNPRAEYAAAAHLSYVPRMLQPVRRARKVCDGRPILTPGGAGDRSSTPGQAAGRTERTEQDDDEEDTGHGGVAAVLTLGAIAAAGSAMAPGLRHC